MEDVSLENCERLNGMITILFPGYYQPIWDLYNLYKAKSGKVKGYPQSIVLLCDALLESFLVRLMYDNNSELKSAEKYFEKYCKKNKINSIYHDYREIALVRNCVAHNHIWLIDLYQNNETDELIETSFVKLFGHDSEYVDLTKKKTKNNKINVIPDRIDFADINTILKLLIKILISVYEIERVKGHHCINPEATRLKYKSKLYSFPELIDKFVKNVNP